jgi:tetratricopeptide (TPR) repeat protein
VSSKWQPEPPPTEAPDGDEEATLLGEALTRLHRSHDAPGALSAIARYSERFPRGQLAGEATLVQAEALSRLGRREELVARLDPDTIAQSPRPADLKLLRAEALAQLGRCREAIPAFSEIVEANQPSLLERSLFGRALCLANEGRVNQARDDLSQIVVHFPKARPKVAQMLDGLNR